MDIEQLIRSRRTVHQFSNRDIPAEIVTKALELALWAPNHRLTFPCKFYDIGPESRQQVIDLAVNLKLEKNHDAFTFAMQQSLRDKLGSASKMIFLGIRKCEDEFQAREDYATLACGVQNMSLYLWSEGVGTKWSTAEFTSVPQIYKILGIDAKSIEIVGVLLVGTFEGNLKVPPRPSLAKFLEVRP